MSQKKTNYNLDPGNDLTIINAEAIRTLILKKFSETEKIVIKHDSRSQADISYVQLLIAAKKFAEGNKKEFSIGNRNESINSLIMEAGINSNIFS